MVPKRFAGVALAVALAAAPTSSAPARAPLTADQLMIVDCLLPGQMRKLGRHTQYTSARRPVQTTARDCEIRGGEYTQWDRANYQTALQVWLQDAKQGSAEAQTIVGEIYEQGLGVDPDYRSAAEWFAKAADQNYARAQINLAFLYEQGLGVDKDSARALQLYQAALGVGDGKVTLGPARLVEQTAGIEQLVVAIKDGETELEERKARLAGLPQPAAGEEARQLAARIAELEGQLAGWVATVESRRSEAATRAEGVTVAAAQAGVPVPPPRIELIDPRPVVARGAREVVLRSRTLDRAMVVGQVEAPAGLEAFTVNGQDRRPSLTGGNLFSIEVELHGERTEVALAATDPLGQQAQVEFSFLLGGVPAAVGNLPRVSLGAYYALVIGNDDYQYWPRLETAVHDARAVAQVLRERYGFREVVQLENASRLDVLAAIEDLREKLGSGDNLLVYYAGHGYLEKGENLLEPEMYWIPVDGERDRVANWIPTAEISRHLNRLEARGVLVITDSCYSGWLVGAGAAEPDSADERATEEYVELLSQPVARLALTSGALQPVLDEGGGENSVFAKPLLEILRTNTELLSSRRLFRLVRASVEESTRRQMQAYDGAGFIQSPDYGGIRRSRHEGGEFFLRPLRPQ